MIKYDFENIKRYPDGSIDTSFYSARARRMRSEDAHIRIDKVMRKARKTLSTMTISIQKKTRVFLARRSAGGRGFLNSLYGATHILSDQNYR